MMVAPDTLDLRLISDRSSIGVTRAFGQVIFKQNEERDEHVVCATPQLYIWSREELVQEVEAATPRTTPSECATNEATAGAKDCCDDNDNDGDVNDDDYGNDKDDSRSDTDSDTEPVMRTHFDEVKESSPPPTPRLFLALYSDSFTEALCDLPGSEKDETTHRPRQVIKNCLSNETVLVLFSEVLRSNKFNCSVSAEMLAAKQAKKFLFNGKYYGDNTSLILVDLENVQQTREALQSSV